MHAKSGKITVEQMKLAEWLRDQAVSPFRSQDKPTAPESIPASVEGVQGMRWHDYNLAATMASGMSPTHIVMYVPEYGGFYFMPRPNVSFPVCGVSN